MAINTYTFEPIPRVPRNQNFEVDTFDGIMKRDIEKLMEWQKLWQNNNSGVDSSVGYIGIGTSNPTAPLTIQGTEDNKAIDVLNTEQTPILKIWNMGDNGETAGRLQIYDANENTIIDLRGDGGNQYFTEGDVGIGTNSPDVALHILGSSGNKYMKIETEDTSAAAGIQIIGGNSDESLLWFGDSDDSDIGRIVYDHSSDEMQFYTNNSQAMVINSDGSVGIRSDSPDYDFEISQISSSNTIGLSCFSSTNSDRSIVYFNKSNSDTQGTYVSTADGENIGQFRFNGTDASNDDRVAAYISVVQEGASGANYVPGRIDFYTTNSSGANNSRMAINTDGEIYMPSVYSDTVTSSRDLEIQSDGKIGYVTSSRKYKKNIKNVDSIDWFYNLTPVHFEYKNDNLQQKHIGLIAEDLYDINPDFVILDENGDPDSIHYKRLISPMIYAVGNNHRLIQNRISDLNSLRGQLNALQNRVRALENRNRILK